MDRLRRQLGVRPVGDVPRSAQLLALFKLGDQASVLWLYNYSILLMILSCFYIPASRDPFRYRANAWLLVVGGWCR